LGFNKTFKRSTSKVHNAETRTPEENIRRKLLKSGVSVIELIIGLGLLVLVVAAGAYSLKPISQANKRFRLTSKAQRLENEIRRGIYYQDNYNPAGFKIVVGGVVLAQEGEIRYVREDLSEAKTTPDIDFPLKTQISLVNNAALPSGWGLVYQVSAVEYSITQGGLAERPNSLAKLGTAVWPTNLNDYVTHSSTKDSVLGVPQELATSIAKSCPSGIMRGLRRKVDGTFDQICWEFKTPATPPDWAIPTAYTLNSTTNAIELEYSPLNRPQCPGMSITNYSGKSWVLPNFYAFSSLDLRDFFPRKSAGTSLASQCEKVINFTSSDETGLLPKALVSNPAINKKPGYCPDKNLYVLDNGNCKVNFDIFSIPERKPAQVSP